MDIEGTYTLQAAPEDVWRCLLDQEMLQKTIPGVERVEMLEDNRYAVAMHLGTAPLAGTYHGHVTISGLQCPSSYHVSIEGEGNQRKVSGEGDVHLSKSGEYTIVTYKGTFEPGKLGTIMPAPVMRGAAKLLIQQFFLSLSEHMRIAGYATEPGITMEEGISIQEQPRGKIVILPARARRTPLEIAVRRLGLGAGDPESEARWARRIKLVSIVAGLLLLIWVGKQISQHE